MISKLHKCKIGILFANPKAFFFCILSNRKNELQYFFFQTTIVMSLSFLVLIFSCTFRHVKIETMVTMNCYNELIEYLDVM